MPPSPASVGRVAPIIQAAAQPIATLNNLSPPNANCSNSTTNDASGNGTNINVPIAALTTTVNNNTNNTDESTNTNKSSSTSPPSSIVSSNPNYDIDNPNFYTKDEEDDLQRINDYCRNVIPTGKGSTHYDNALELKNHIQQVAGDKFGFKVSIQGSCIECLNADAPAHEDKRTKKRKQNLPAISQRDTKKRRMGCTYKVNFTPAISSKTRVKDDKSVRVSKANFLHSDGCRPSSQQLLRQHVVSGTFTRKNVSQHSIGALLNMMRYQDHVDSKTIRNILKEILPEEQKVDAALIANVRSRAKIIVNDIKKEEYGKMKNITPTITTDDADKLIEESIEDAKNNRLCGKELNDSVGLATRELEIMLSDALEKGKELDQIICLLSQAKARDPAFDFRVAKNKTGKIVGLCWQDGIMRGHCQGGLMDVVMLDMMKRQQNTADWPYCGPILITGENKIACACEAIVLSEGTSYYSWIMNSVYDMAGVDRSETKIIFGDGIHSNNLLRQLNIEDTSNLIFDRYHLIEVDWKKKFGFSWPSISEYMRALVYAKTEDDYEKALSEVRKRVKSTDLQNYIDNEVHSNRKHFVDAWIKSYPLQLNRQGDQGAEANHSSYCNRISFGGFVQPAEQVVQCLERSKDIAKELDSKRYESFTSALQDAATLRKEGKVDECNALLQLAPEGKRLWDEAQREYNLYSTRTSTTHPDCVEVYRNEDQASLPRIIGPNKPCNCPTAIAYNALCPHQCRLDEGKFNIDRFPKRYHRLNKAIRVKRVHDSSGIVESMLDNNMQQVATTTTASMSTSNITQELPSVVTNTSSDSLVASIHSDMMHDAAIASSKQSVQVFDEKVSIEPPKKKQKKMDYNGAMQFLRPLAELIASHKHQHIILGGVNGLTHIARSGKLDEQQTFQDLMVDHLETFSNYNVNEYLKPAASMKQPANQRLDDNSMGDMVRRNAGSNSHKQRKTRIRSITETKQNHLGFKMPKKIDEITCSVCDNKGHKKGLKCELWSKMCQHHVKKDDVLALTTRLGEPSLHEFSSCPPMIEQDIKQREASNTDAQPWPHNAKHCVVIGAYYDCDVPAIATRFGNDPRIGNTLNNIIGVQYLEKNWCKTDGVDVYVDKHDGNRSTFYYRAHAIQDIIINKIKGKSLLFNKLKKKK